MTFDPEQIERDFRRAVDVDADEPERFVAILRTTPGHEPLRGRR